MGIARAVYTTLVVVRCDYSFGGWLDSGAGLAMQYVNARPDPKVRAHQAFPVSTSTWGKIKAVMLRMPALISGMSMVGARGMATGNLMPADFLIDEQGTVVETYYGKDAGDHIPMERIELFAVRGMALRRAA